MLRRTLTGAATAALAAAAVACRGRAGGATASGASAGGAKKTATIDLEKGSSITIELFAQDAPKTVENFVKKADAGFYNGLIFHRVEDWVVQGGDPNGNGTGGGQMPTEINERPFVVGSVGVARGQDIRISNDAQFFICTKPAEWLNRLYTNFGLVTDGMDTVRRIQRGDKMARISIKG